MYFDLKKAHGTGIGAIPPPLDKQPPAKVPMLYVNLVHSEFHLPLSSRHFLPLAESIRNSPDRGSQPSWSGFASHKSLT